jgi:hypothetical protein
MKSSAARFFKPTLDTPYHIDFDWWERGGNELRVYLRSHLCPEHQEVYDNLVTEQMDWVDPYTAEVKQLDGVMFLLRSHCSKQEDYITLHTSVVDALFRVFLINGNQPLTARQLAERIGKDAGLILKTIGGHAVYKGLRPALEAR